jgi:tRNA-dihydrouridine synthase A
MAAAMTDGFRLSVAPMVGVTTRAHRYLTRLLSQHAILYTEMCTDQVLLHAKPELVASCLTPEASGPVVLQLASHDPAACAIAAEMGERAGFAEINLNCGCPSSKTAKRACNGLTLMRQPELVRDIVHECSRRLSIPITVKCRLGVDNLDSFEFVSGFVRCVAQGGAKRFAIHARKGLLSGLGTRGNRSVPPLKHDWVNKLAALFPELDFELNGGLVSLEDVMQVRNEGVIAGCMIGRKVWTDPCFIYKAELALWAGEEEEREKKKKTRSQVIKAYADHFDDAPLLDRKHLIEPIMHMFHGTRHSTTFRRRLHAERSSEERRLGEVVRDALSELPNLTEDEDAIV